MLLRYALATLGGRGPRSLATSPILSSASRLVVSASQPSFPHVHIEKLKFAQAQTRPSSGLSDDATQIDNLQPPYTAKDLSKIEKRAYKKYGPKFLEHLSPEHRAKAEEAAEKRAKGAADYEEQFGPHWYSLTTKALGIVRRQRSAEVAALRKRKVQAFDSLHAERDRKRAEISSTLAQRDESLKELRVQLRKEYRAADADQKDFIKSRIKEVGEQKHLKLPSEASQEVARLHTWFTEEALPKLKQRFSEEERLLSEQYVGESWKRKRREITLQLLQARG